MFKKMTSRFFLVSLAFVLLCGNTFGVFVELDVPLYEQEKDNWCWVASGKMAGNYLSPTTSVSQSQLVMNIKGAIVDEPGDIWETASAMQMSTFPMEYASPKINGYFSWADTKTSIDHGYPLVALVSHSTFSSGHYYVIIGYDPSYNKIKVNDSFRNRTIECSWYGFTIGNWQDSRPYQNTVYFDNWNS